MRQFKLFGTAIAGFSAGAVNGLFGAGGGMVLIPLLTKFGDLRDEEIFPASITIILPICVTSLCAAACHGGISWSSALPYLPGSALGGLLAGLFGRRIPTVWLHRSLGVMILLGGIRYLC